MELNQVIKKKIRKNNMLGQQPSDQQFYMKGKDEEKRLKSLRDIYEKPWLRVKCYISCQIIMDQGRNEKRK